jgi:hypothetical protein
MTHQPVTVGGGQGWVGGKLRGAGIRSMIAKINKAMVNSMSIPLHVIMSFAFYKIDSVTKKHKANNKPYMI